MGETKIPSTVTKQLKFRILHVGVNLTVSEESTRIEDVWVGVHRFIMKHRPFQRSNSCQTTHRMIAYHVLSIVNAPAGINTPLYTSSSIATCPPPGGTLAHSTQKNCTKNCTERDRRSPPNDLLYNGRDVGQLRLVGEFWQTIPTRDLV